MTWPSDDLTNDELDQGTDDPSQARDELNSAVLKIKAIIAGAVSAATASCVVLRDGLGDFAARVITVLKIVGDVAAANGAVVLDSGTDGSDAVFTGDVNGNVNGNVSGDLEGDIYASNGSSKILESGTDGGDASFVGAVDLRGGEVNLGSDATGDMWYRDASGLWTRLPVGLATQVLKGGTVPAWGAAVPVDSVGQGELKTAQGSVSLTNNIAESSSSSLELLPGGEYGFYPQSKNDGDGSSLSQLYAKSGVTGSYGTYIALAVTNESGQSGTVYAQQRYVQNSPPYKIGDINWGHFLFILRNKSTKEVVSTYEAEDPPWAYNGNPANKKDSVERVEEMPHPFADYISPGSLAAAGLEIVLVDLSSFSMANWKAGNPGKSIIEDLGNVAPMGKLSNKGANIPSSLTRFNSLVKLINRT